MARFFAGAGGGGPSPKRAAIVPVKDLSRAKSRLAGVLGEGRADLALAMAADVLDALSGFDTVFVVTSDARVSRLARERGAVVVAEPPGDDMNLAVAAGLAAADADTLVVVPGDVPLATAAELARLVSAYEASGAAVGLLRGGDGTNLLCVRSPFAPRFGPGSFEAHKAASPSVVELRSDTLSLDIDTPDDLAALKLRLMADPAAAPHTRRALGVDAPLSAGDALRLGEQASLPDLMAAAAALRDRGFGEAVTFSKKVFLPLTHLCRDTCRYCVFAQAPRQVTAPYMTVDEAVAIARRGAELGCKEALFTLGDRPEARYRVAAEWLEANGFSSTLAYVEHVARAVLEQTGLLPHINAGCMDAGEIARLRTVAPSMGLMLENVSPRLCEKGGPHYGSPDKDPAVRLATIAEAGRQRVPFTTGVLIGIGETRAEIVQSLVAIRDLHDRYGHIQEVIVQNFAPKAGTKMADAPAASPEALLWATAMARLILGPAMSIQAPPNLSPEGLRGLVTAGINDWGGVSPLTPDHVNPEAPWPNLDSLARQTAQAGKRLQERLTVYPAFIAPDWIDAKVHGRVLRQMDSTGLAREDDWLTGRSTTIPAGLDPDRKAARRAKAGPLRDTVRELVEVGPAHLGVAEIARLFDARGDDFHMVCEAADRAREAACGETVTYVVNRNINYTNICTHRCSFCAFSKGRRQARGGDAPYLLDLAEIGERAAQAWSRGATEVCLQGGIHPTFTGRTYLDICAAVKAAAPDIHVHAFSPLEVTHGARTLGMTIEAYLSELRGVGLASLPGTAAEILHDPVRAVICPDKLTSREWLEVIETAHEVGLPTTSTMMYGHVEGYGDWAIHLRELLALQRRTGGLTEFVPLPFVAQEAPVFLKGQARAGPTFREAVLVHAVARLVLKGQVRNIQTSWVKMGLEGAAACLRAGANDLGGTLMNESITRAAGATHGQEMTAERLEAAITAAGRRPARRSTLYGQSAATPSFEEPAYVEF